jgi:hypothetical protein
MDFPTYKELCRGKHNRSKASRKNQCQKVSRKIASEMDLLKSQIANLRRVCGNKNPPELMDLVDELSRLKKKMRCRSITAHSGDFDLPDLLKSLNSFIEYLKAAREVVGEELLAFVVDLTTTLYNIYANSSWTSISINLTSFITRHFPKEYVDYVFASFTAIFQMVTAQSGYSEIKDFFLRIFESTDSLVNDELWTKVSEFFVKVTTLYGSLMKMVSFESIDVKTVIRQYKLFQKTIPATKDVIESIFNVCEFVYGHWAQIVSGDWSVLFLGKNEAKSFETEVRILESSFSFALSNHVVELHDNFNMSPADWEKRMEKAIKDGEIMARACTSEQQKLAISNFLRTLYARRTDWYARLADAPSRLEPFGVKMSGPSSCGKSTMCELMSKIMMDAYELDSTLRGSVVLTNIMEKFESTVKPSHKIIICDDVCNNKNDKPNYDRILNYINTVPRPLEKAGVEEKGKFYPGNVGVIVTSNVEDLCATKHSNCPESILRRFGLHLHVKIREPFRNSFGGLKPQTETRFDVYELELCTFSQVNDHKISDENDEISSLESLEGPAHSRETESGVVWNIIPRSEWIPDGSQDRDFAHMCVYLAQMVRKHRKNQIAQLENKKKLDSGDFCSICHVPELLCTCQKCTSDETIITEEELEKVLTTVLDDGIIDTVSVNSESENIDEDLANVTSQIDDPEQEVSAQFGDALATLSTRALWQFRLTLTGSLQNASLLYRNATFWQLAYSRRCHIGKYLCLLIGLPYTHLFCGRAFALISTFVAMCGSIYWYYSLLREVDAVLRRRVDYFSSTCETVRDHLRHNVQKYFAFGVSMYALYRAYKAYRVIYKTSEDKNSYLDKALPVFNQLVKKPPREYRVRTQDERDYKEGYSRLPPKMSKIAATTTAADLKEMVAHSSRVVIIKSKGEMFGTVNGLMVAGNVIMIPSHALPDTDEFDIETTSTPLVPSAKTKDQKVTRNMVYTLPERDMSLVHLPSAPPSRNFAEFFPETEPTFRSRATVCVFKSHENEIYESYQPIRPYYNDKNERSLTYIGRKEKPGTFYGVSQKLHQFTIENPFICELEFDSFSGLCGSSYIDTEKALIYGFHVAGYTAGGHTGWLTSITKPMINKGLESLQKRSHALVTHSAGVVNVDPYNTGYTIENAKPLYLREDGMGAEAVVTFMGKVKKCGQELASNARSPYIPTPFKGVKEILGECKHIPPTKPNDIAKSMKTLNKLHDPVQHYEHAILEKAVNDYRDQTLECIRTNKEELRDVLRMYSQEEAMDGTHDGNLCGLPNATSAGYGIDKSKKHCLVRDPMDESLTQIPREFSDTFDVQSEIDRTEECWRNGTRSEPIYKASSKVNELLPIKKARDKVRKFYGSPFANFVASRKVLGGIPIFMRKFWRETECLVGVNPMSGEWQEFEKFLTKFGDQHMIAGDFSGFDTRMAAQITSSAAKIMVSWYEEMGLNEKDLELLKGALSDIIIPNILFDGDLYRFANGNPSGNLITVQLNSICNSIMMRYVYYALNRKVARRFCENVTLGTYGDDNAMGVRKDCGWFNHSACLAEFEKIGIGYTMADKDAKSVPYLPLSQISFLKRGFQYHEELATIVAPIEEDSILKKFHFVKKPNESPLSFEAQWGAYTDGAFREAYLLGREYYETFSSKMQEIVRLNPELKMHVSFIPYPEMTNILKNDYTGDYHLKPRKLFAESIGVEESFLDDIFQE